MNPIARFQLWSLRANLDLAQQSLDRGDVAESIRRFEVDLKMRRKVLAKVHDPQLRALGELDAARAALALAWLYQREEVHDRLAAVARYAYDTYRANGRLEQAGLAAILFAGASGALGRRDESGSMLRENYDELVAACPDAEITVTIGQSFANNLLARQEYDAAEPVIAASRKRAARVHGPESYQVRQHDRLADRVRAGRDQASER
ncbi:hypothetical protein [Dactylosporangium sp. NPDC051541]|uniref:hypothetical protein n=1 Tax=Dactylosporangium sp. NPDC051541 TaxID=3363977 RepID=UPI0037A5AC82